MKNKKIIVALCLCVVAAFFGCGKKEDTSTASNNEVELVTDTPTATAEVTTTAEATATPTPTVDPTEIEEVTGTIKSFTGGSLILEDGEDNSLSFDLESAQLECSNGILAGDEVSVIYQGTIYGTDTSDAVVLKVIDKANREELSEETISGEISDASMNTLTLETEDDDEVIFTTIGADIQCADGLSIGDWVTITYKGEIKGGIAKNVKVISIVDDETHDSDDLDEDDSDDDDDLPVPTPNVVNPDTGAFSVTGTVMACSMNSMTIVSDDGAQLTSTIDEADLEMDELPTTGSYVTVTMEPNGESNVYKALTIAYAS